MWITSSLTSVRVPTAIALGNFDGVHKGHRYVIDPVLSIGKNERTLGESSDTCATVVTFDPHPQEFFSGRKRALLTPLNEKIEYLSSIGVQQLVLLPFTAELASLTPEEFVESILVRHLQAGYVSVGQNFRFGCHRSGTTDDLKAIASPFGIHIYTAPLRTCQGARVSSSAIRQALADGNLTQANQLLGRPYRLIGRVVHGQHLGRTLGFPTANLELPSDKLLPCHGVYYVRVAVSPHRNTEYLQSGVMNIGLRPTVNGIQQTVEVHLLDWLGDLYGTVLSIDLHKFLRPEQKFASLTDLKQQIQADCDVARSLVVCNEEQSQTAQRFDV
ncbi:MAG: bifunctional riboflavin kinase/FAD synthetase [Elainellaceae cyanobacterium]